MRIAAIQILTASVIFFVLITGFEILARGAVFDAETLMSGVFRTIIFAMAYAAIVVGMIIFRGEKK